MPSKRPQFVTGEIYHVFNRGVEKRNIFQQISDYFRFIFCLYELNDKNLVIIRERIKQRKQKKYRGATPVKLVFVREKEPLVEILAFCLMPNHYHLVLRQLRDNGISLFMKKLADSYIGYFNLKYNRKGMGSLFQGRFKAVHIKTDEQFINLICYIFTNPVELLERNWKEGGIRNPKKVIHYLESYKWSSFLDCIEKTNFPSVTKRDFLIEVFGGPEKVKEYIKNWILDKAELRKGIERLRNLTLE